MEELPDGKQVEAGPETLAELDAPSPSPLPHPHARYHRLLLHFGEMTGNPRAVAADVDALASLLDGRFRIEAVAASEEVALAIGPAISTPGIPIEVLPIAPSVPNPGTLALAEHHAAERLADRISRAEIVLAWGGTALLDRAVKVMAAPPPIVLCGNHASWRGQDDAPAPPPPASPAGWRPMIEEVLAARTPAPPPAIFQSFLQGGFECSTHRLANGKRLDLIAAIGHDAFAEADYLQAQEHGMRTLRDGVRWHLIERTPGEFDFSSLTPMMDAARRTGTQIIWDLLHYGWPDDVDPFGPDFVP